MLAVNDAPLSTEEEAAIQRSEKAAAAVLDKMTRFLVVRGVEQEIARPFAEKLLREGIARLAQQQAANS